MEMRSLKNRALAMALSLTLLFQSVAPITVWAEDAPAESSILYENGRLSQEEKENTHYNNEDFATQENEDLTKPEDILQKDLVNDQQNDMTVSEDIFVESSDDFQLKDSFEDEEREQETADLSAEGTVQVTQTEQLLNGVPEGSIYILANDLVMNDNEQIGTIAGVLDGAGHTITINGKALVRELTGTIQNLLVAGKANLQNGEGSIVGTVKGGTIQNCASTVKINPGWAVTLGGIAGIIENGKIYNSYFAGTGKDEFGLVSISGIMADSGNADAPSQIKNCYYTEGNNLGGGTAWNRDDKSNGKKSPDEMKTAQTVVLLNAANVGSGYIWAEAENEFPKLVVGGGEAEHSVKTELKSAIEEAERKNETDYTEQSWALMKQALQQAKEVYEKIDASQNEVDAAAQALKQAIENLDEKALELFPVKPPQEGIVLISSQQDFSKIDTNDSKRFYRLTQDLVIEGEFMPRDLTGVFDGNGHTITLRTANPLFTTIGETGVVQNLFIKVEGNFTNRQQFAPYAEKLKGGMIVNCISDVTGQHSAGFVRKMDGGVMVNCLTMGHNRRGAFVYYQKSTSHQNINGYTSGKFYNCYWSASNSVENIEPAENLIRCKAVGDVQLRSEEFLKTVNNQKGEFGAAWGRDANGYPYFGADQGDCVINGSSNRYEVEFVWRDNKVTKIENGQLELSPQMTDNNSFAGSFRLKGVPENSTITWSCNDRADHNVMQLDENLRLSVFHDGGAVIRATEHKADGSKELAAEFRVISASREIEQLRVVMDGQVIENSATVQGSAEKILKIQAKYADSENFESLPSYLVTLKAEKPDILRTDYQTATFRFTKPGTSKLTVTEITEKEHPVSVTVSLTSQYVPVKSVKPAISGKVDIHYRNSMGTGEFIWIPQTVFVEPSNASYKNDVTISSSNTAIAEYNGNFYIPYKNGTVTFTSRLNDNGKIIEGTSTAEFVYKNPLTEVTAPSQAIVLKQGEKQPLTLTFKGQPGSQHQVTEPDLNWTFDKNGIVSIQRPDALMQVRNSGGPDDGNWVASTKFEVKGLKPGTVVATGTPVDSTAGAKPVQLTITVKGNGSNPIEFDIDEFIQKGKKSASGYLYANNSFTYGEDWSIFTLLRDGQSLPQDQLDKYYADVVANAQVWKSDVLVTDVERTIFALNIIGKDITNVGGVDLAELIYNHPNLTKQGSNALSWALIALDMKNTEIPDSAKWSRDRLLKELLTYQNRDGGFGLDKTGVSGIDITAMSVQALARYQGRSEVDAAIEKAVAYMAAAVQKNLNLGSSESIAQVIIALSVLNRDLVQEPGFGDEADNLMSALSEYMVEDEGFKHIKNGKPEKMASVQSMQALCAYERLLNGQSGYWDLDGSGIVEDPVAKVTKMIDLLPDQVTAADTAAVKAARNAFDALTEEQKSRVQNLEKLLKAEKALEQLLEVQAVIDAIEALPKNITLQDAYTVKIVRMAYNQLTAEQKTQVSNESVLTTAEKALRIQAIPEKIIKMIEDLPEHITMADKLAIQNTRAAYELLNMEQQAKVTNLSKLENAEQQLESLETEQKVKQVIDAINALPQTITLQDEEAVKAVRAAYEQLNEEQKTKVTNLQRLMNAEKSIEDQKAASEVEKAIEGLPNEISMADQQAVQAARDAYDRLNAEQKSFVKNLDKLINAETALKNLCEAYKVMEMIKNLPLTITIEDEETVKEIRKAYNKLTQEQQALVANLYILERAEKTIGEKKSVQAVENAIDELPENITLQDEAAIKAARTAYNKLSPELKKQVKNVDKLIKAERALRALQKPGGLFAGKFGTETNVVDAVVENGMVSEKQLAEIQGKDLILRVEATMETGESYTLFVYGKDVVKAVDFKIGMQRKGLYEDMIHKLADDPEVFRFAETGAFLFPVMVEMDTSLADGDYLLLHYDPEKQEASLVSRVQAAGGKVQFIVEQGGEYFLAKKAKAKYIPQQEETSVLLAESQQAQSEPQEVQAVQQSPQGEKTTGVWFFVPALVAAAGVLVLLMVMRKRKEKEIE